MINHIELTNLMCKLSLRKNQATSLDIAVKRRKMNKNKKSIFQFKTWNCEHPNHLHFVCIVSGRNPPEEC